jgi:hypothetical protein
MMNRREAIKGMSLSLGYVVAAPAVMGILESCTGETQMWTSVFFTDNEKNVVVQLVDIILPSSDTPGGLELNLPQFIDMMCNDVMTASDKDIFHQGSQVFSERFSKRFHKEITKAKKKEVLALFGAYFDKTPEESGIILEQQKKRIEEIPAEGLEDYLMYKYLMAVRTISLLGYFTSEKIGKEVLNFDPIPGVWKPCIPVEEVGNAWTI